jgi:hypothetical protein
LAEGASEQGEVGERDAGLKRDEDARRWPENARSWAHPRRGTWAGGWGRTDRWGSRDRERGRACERNGADKTGPLGTGRKRRERACGRDRPTGGVRLSERAGARARAWAGPTWANLATLAFSISREFLMPFLFIFSRVFNSNSNQVSNSN